jgi:fermentation-respiration switch protein FrsA (DUF1100 family)
MEHRKGQSHITRKSVSDAYEQAAEPKEFYVVPNAGHVDLYDETDLIPFDKLRSLINRNIETTGREL